VLLLRQEGTYEARLPLEEGRRRQGQQEAERRTSDGGEGGGAPSHLRQPRPPHLSRISRHFGCISQTITFSEASHDRPIDVFKCESRCMDSLQSNVIRLTGCGGGMYNLIHLFPTSFKP